MEQIKDLQKLIKKMVERDAFQVVGIKRNCPCGDGGGANGIAEFWGEVNQNGTIPMLVQLMNGEIKGLSRSVSFRFNQSNLAGCKIDI